MSRNRLASPAVAPSSAETPRHGGPSTATLPWLPEETQEVDFATFTPLGYEAGYAYPLIVWLHGSGSSERELPQVMRHVSPRNFLAVAPRGVSDRVNEEYGWRQESSEIEQAETAVEEAIEAAAHRYNVNAGKVFIAGVGAGGTMAMRLGLRRPEWFAGAASIDGPLPRRHRPLCRVNEARGLPLLLSASRDSVGYPEPSLCSDLALLHSAGFHVAVRQYPGEDELTTAMLADVNRWAMDLVCG